MAFLTGLQAGVHLMAASVATLALGCGTIWLANSDFTPGIRLATIMWGICLVALFAFACFHAYDSSVNGGLIFFGAELLFAAPIPILALRSPYRGPDASTT